MFFRSFTSFADQKRSAIAAVRGQILESIVSGVTNSLHIVASAPKILLRSSLVKIAFPIGSTK